jgi:hypothetical protein
VLADHLHLHAPSQERREIPIRGGGLETGEAAIREVAQARAELNPQHGAENENVVKGAAGVGEMRVDLQRRAVVQQSIKHIRGLVAGGRHDARAVGPMLVGDVGVKAPST